MTRHLPALLAIVTFFLGASVSQAAPIAGIDFDDGVGGYSRTPDDLDLLDGITVSDVGQIGAGLFTTTVDANSNTGRASAPVGKVDGAGDSSANPGVGADPTAQGAFFSITIPADVTLDLDNVSWISSQATGGNNTRWLAFKTSLDSTLIYSEVGVFRPDVDTVSLDLTDAKYKGLSDTTIDFQWYAGGTGTGDQDIDSIVINGTVVPVPEPSAFVLAALGAFGAIALAWRRRRRSNA